MIVLERDRTGSKLGREVPVPTVKVQAHKKSYGRYLYLSVPKPVVEVLGWSEGDICEVFPDKEGDALVFKRVYKKKRGRQRNPIEPPDSISLRSSNVSS